jgi:hypothetical protein
MLKLTRNPWTLCFAVLLATRALAATDPTSEQIYQAAQSGQLARAEQMIEQVLRDHPKSARAHYVAAEVYAKEGHISAARRELSTAQDLAPGLPFAKSESVAALKRELAGSGTSSFVASRAPTHGIAPFAMFGLLLAGIGVLWLVLRGRREPAPAYPAYPVATSPVAASPGATPFGGGAGVMGAPTAGSGIGSSIAGGLASGLAVGAGVVAGEELARHFLDSDRNEHVVFTPEREPVESTENSNMGGDDFGLTDSSSWDDDGAGSGGDDWT